jgi:hypothetical protein
MSRTNPLNRHVVEVRKRPTVCSALMQLQEAHDLACTGGRPDRDFALSLACLIAGGSSAAAVQWLVYEGYAQQLARKTKSHGRAEPSHNGTINDQSRFTITTTGLELALAIDARQPENRANGRHPSTSKPRWVAKKRELWVGNQLVKRIARNAKNQSLILDVFEEEGWVESIDDPMSGGTHAQRRKRLKNVVARLNRSQIVRLLRFHLNGTGDGVRWELIRSSKKSKRRR